MKKKYKILIILAIVLAVISLTAIPAFALTESEVQAQVDEVGKEGVTGNILVWFLCAIAFLKVSQKIDSFMSSLGINVGNTGGSMLTEALLAARGFSMAKNFAGFRGGGGGSSGSGGSGGSGGARFMQGGLAGVVGRQITKGAVKNATGNGSGGLGGRIFASSMSKGGGFANSIIGRVAQGNIRTDGLISGEGAGDALSSYMGYNGDESAPGFSDVEIGGGRIMATETNGYNPDGIAMGMYSTEQYMAPTGEYSTVTATDGSTWYKQYAADTLVKKPYVDSQGEIQQMDYIEKRLPKPPPRKDKV